MFCSIIIPTIGRNTIQRAVHSILNQNFTATSFEVIVVNDSGRPLPPADWQQSDQVRVLNTNKRERSVARNTGAAVARGKYLGFLDDDDWLLPDALSHYWNLAQKAPDAVCLYGGIQIIDEATDACLAELNSGLNGNSFTQIMGGAWVPIQSSLVLNKAFFEVGGYDPSITGTEDLDLTRRIALKGDFANTEMPIGCLSRGDLWTTSTDYGRAPQDTLRSRDKVLAESGAFNHLMISADNAYWHGRIFRIYLSTAKWAWQKRQITIMISRTLFGLFSIIKSSRYLPSAEYWQGVKDHHVPGTLHFVIEALEKQNRQL
jgi:glycosyltransferase involved in cell wall biosynthesis